MFMEIIINKSITTLLHILVCAFRARLRFSEDWTQRLVVLPRLNMKLTKVENIQILKDQKYKNIKIDQSLKYNIKNKIIV